MKKASLILILTIVTSLNAQKNNKNNVHGSWGLDYLKDYVQINNFDIKNSNKKVLKDTYKIDRNATASGEVKGNINLFRHILKGNNTLDVKAYRFLNFEIKNNEPVEIVIMQDDNRKWKNRLRYTIPVNLEKKSFHISFSNFKDIAGNSVTITNIKTIVFSIIGDYKNYKTFNFSVNAVSLCKNIALNTDNFSIVKTTKLINYPNPFRGTTTIKLSSGSEFIQIKVFNLLGKLVDSKKINTDNSMNTVKYNASNLKNGIYKYHLKDDKNKLSLGTFILH